MSRMTKRRRILTRARSRSPTHPRAQEILILSHVLMTDDQNPILLTSDEEQCPRARMFVGAPNSPPATARASRRKSVLPTKGAYKDSEAARMALIREFREWGIICDGGLGWRPFLFLSRMDFSSSSGCRQCSQFAPGNPRASLCRPPRMPPKIQRLQEWLSSESS
ncbi:hypothetical protein QBC38DRAFT_502533 [Podospora fimiseda]|uniref:Uncharacterized protein n=1 Tax=Podospora fimiseda TaxID=252190 RepID=A0AAN7BIN8_9PEZI|nr:hypothetical protein QBC38DRAFT_502533 [Podospora fimiseda]